MRSTTERERERKHGLFSHNLFGGAFYGHEPFELFKWTNMVKITNFRIPNWCGWLAFMTLPIWNSNSSGRRRHHRFTWFRKNKITTKSYFSLPYMCSDVVVVVDEHFATMIIIISRYGKCSRVTRVSINILCWMWMWMCNGLMEQSYLFDKILFCVFFSSIYDNKKKHKVNKRVNE